MGVPFELFDDDYLYFYADVLGAQRSDADAALISDLLSLRPGMRVLDAPCGEGRIAGRLAQRGCDVVGIDATERFLELARDRHPRVAFDRRDLRKLEYEDEFDAAVNWFTSFGYFDPADQRRRTGRPGPSAAARRAAAARAPQSLAPAAPARSVRRDRRRHRQQGR